MSDNVVSQDAAFRPWAVLEAAKKQKRRAPRKEMNLRIRLHRMGIATGTGLNFILGLPTAEQVARLEAWERENPAEAADVSGLSTVKSDK